MTGTAPDGGLLSFDLGGTVVSRTGGSPLSRFVISSPVSVSYSRSPSARRSQSLRRSVRISTALA